MIAEYGTTCCGKSLWSLGVSCSTVSPHSLLCTPSSLKHAGRAVCRGEKTLVHISSCSRPHCPSHDLFPKAMSRQPMDTALASSGSVLGLAGTGSGQNEGSCCSQKLPTHFKSLPQKPSPQPWRCRQYLLPKGQMPWRGCQALGQSSCWDTGQEIFVSAPAPWPWQ